MSINDLSNNLSNNLTHWEKLGYDAVIGIEVHVQLKTESKIFSSDSTSFDSADNENTSPVSLGMPGTLPVMNKKAIEYSIKTGLALGCEIRNKSVFARKNYFYPDLAKGYQISQYDQPICENGKVNFFVNGIEKSVSITRAHMEEDAGKSNHFGDCTLLNYNRAGIPLLEIVTGPDLNSPAEAAEYARTIRQIVRYLDVCDGNLEEGSLRCDCNVSVKKRGEVQLGTKVEIKNINSFRFIEKALDYEIERQIDQIQSGKKIAQETRLYDPDKNRTFSMRSKENAQDYRYFPDPDLLPVLITNEQIANIKKTLPELPVSRCLRFINQLGLSIVDAGILTQEKEVADYFEEVYKNCGNAKASANWVMTELNRELNHHHISILKSPIQPTRLAELIQFIEKGMISGKIAKVVFSEMWTSNLSAAEIIEQKKLVQVSDHNALEKIIDDVLRANPNQVSEFKSGKTKVLGFLIGAIMKVSRGQANPDIVNELLKKKLDNL